MTLPDQALVDDTDHTINRLGSSLYFHPLTTGHAAQAGVANALVLYGAGRVGVLGDVNAAQVTAAVGFLSPSLIDQVWADVPNYGKPSDIAPLYVEAMSVTAATLWSADAAAVVTRLGERVAASVYPLGLSLFAGWRAIPRGADTWQQVTLAVHTLRELRGDLHMQCVSTAGLHPLQAEMVTRGPTGAALHGWPEPWPDPALFAERVAEAERRTGERMTQIYDAALQPAEFAEFASAVAALAV